MEFERVFHDRFDGQLISKCSNNRLVRDLNCKVL